MLVNVARGEIVDEDALAEALQRDHLRGVVLDVYVGEFEHPPPARLWSDPRVLITPHVSGASDQNRHGAIDLFCDNLRAYLDGRPLRNVIDWHAAIRVARLWIAADGCAHHTPYRRRPVPTADAYRPSPGRHARLSSVR